jgi:hypothetical protein
MDHGHICNICPRHTDPIEDAAPKPGPEDFASEVAPELNAAGAGILEWLT